ncbi:MAG: glycosyltransferase [Deltaproteobacteria bacterium]
MPRPLVTLVHQDPSRPSARIRMIDLASHLAARGFDVRLRRYEDGLPSEGIVVIQKKTPTWWSGRSWARIRGPLVYDFDDAVMYRDHPKDGSHESKTRAARFGRAVQLADAFTPGNAYLASFLPADKPHAIIPSAVPHEVARRRHVDGGPLRVVWVGLGHNLRHLATLDPVWRRLASDGTDVELVVVSNESFETNECRVENVAWSLEAQEQTIASCDVGVMPLDADSPWTRGKCAYKLLQYMAAELPVVGSDVGMNREVVVPGEEGFLARDTEAWVEALSRIAASADSRAKMGAAGRRRVETTYTYDAVADRWAELLERLTPLRR